MRLINIRLRLDSNKPLTNAQQKNILKSAQDLASSLETPVSARSYVNEQDLRDIMTEEYTQDGGVRSDFGVFCFPPAGLEKATTTNNHRHNIL